jgi:hypothetical protein
MNLKIIKLLSANVHFRETEEPIEEKITVEVSFKKTAEEFRQTSVRGIYTAWNVTKISFTLKEDEPMKVVLDDTTYWSNVEDKPTGNTRGM